MRRLLSTLFCVATALVSCSGNGKPRPPQPVVPDSITRMRVEILERDLAWILGTVPIIRFNTPYIYGMWRLEVEACSKLKRDGWPKLYWAPISPLWRDHAGRPIGGFFAHDSDAIVFALGEESNKRSMQHEFLHYLAEPLIPPPPPDRNGDGKPDETEDEQEVRVHPAEYFQVRCGHLLKPEA